MSKHLIIIVDDSRPFALHALTILTRTVLYKISTATRDSREHPLRECELVVAPSGRIACCWIEAGDGSGEALNEILLEHQVGVSDLWVIMDVQGKQGAAHIGKVLKRLLPYVERDTTHMRLETHVKLVSSYATVSLEPETEGDRVWMAAFESALRQVHAKSPEFLRSLRSTIERRVLASMPPAQDGSHSACHILITGAGFEQRSTKHTDVTFGVPDTYDLLLAMGRRCGMLDLDSNRQGRRFPRVRDTGRVDARWLVDAERLAERLDAAEDKGSLDAWWDAILQAATAGSSETERAVALRRAREWGLRKAYQQALLAADHGQIVQCIHAARAGWAAWISTNHTRFCDRAIDLAMASQHEESSRGPRERPWQVVCGETASKMFEQEYLIPKAHQEFRWLFKICGDISQIGSMAIAAQDKRAVGVTRYVAMEDISAAVARVRNYVSSLASTMKEKSLWIHIVGHALHDANVVGVIREAMDSWQGDLFLLIVDPEPDDPHARLGAMLDSTNEPRTRTLSIERLKLTAEEYMVRLGLVTATGGLGACTLGPEEWVRRIGSMSWSNTSDIRLASAGGAVKRSAAGAGRGNEDMKEIFTWLHVSDIHGEQGSEAHRDEREMVLDGARLRFQQFKKDGIPMPMALMVTGDVGGYGGAKSASEYEVAVRWIWRVCGALKIDLRRVYMVPGNHDVDRTVVRDGGADVAARWERLRSGTETLADALEQEAFRDLVRRRFHAYLECQRSIHDRGDYGCSGLLWRDVLDMPHAKVHILGINTSLLSQDDADRGNLRLTRDTLKALRDLSIDENPLVLLLGHHPLKWLAEDERDYYIDRLRHRVDIYLCGHEHDYSTDENHRKPYGELQEMVGAAMFMGEGEEKKRHGFDVACVYEQGGRFILRVWPHVWEENGAYFRLHTEKTGGRPSYDIILSPKGG